ncbi:MAG TPA: Tex family protein [Aggregatilinea sp.]|uniref:Tex family protein n=1 Tax=Aggregatilinea sp. TaxID=2806333 RepID=UPI002D19142F|nr:Tex family protein [Aggregatilinea sp.]HML24178.1 Tex family protein [Aggregatilinea sp.]
MPLKRDIAGKLAAELSLRRDQVDRTIHLFDEGNTIPFVARYRKEMTGSLDEEQLRSLMDRLMYLRKLGERQDAVIASITEQGKLTPDLQNAIEAAETLQAVEDLYLPYKPKRRTRAMIAQERGLAPLADLILAQAPGRESAERIAAPFVNADVPTPEDALQGARDIVAERVADDAAARDVVRRLTQQRGSLNVQVADAGKDEKGVYKTYYEFSGGLRSLRPHQVLAINRGESEGALKVRLDAPGEQIAEQLQRQFPAHPHSPLADQLRLAVGDAYKRLIAPAIERELRRDLTEQADRHAIGVFATNLVGLLLQPPLKDHVVLGIDPGFRTGSKAAVVDATGKVLATATIYPHPPQNERVKALHTLVDLIRAHGVDLIAIGNGTASRETEELVAALIREYEPVKYLIVNEAGASVYSASPLARAELPDMDVSMRGAVSIARRALDPLAELVKIDPRSIGVGLYQHDVDQKALEGKLSEVIETVVNRVGVNANTASPALLQHVAGLGPKLAERIVEARDADGPFRSRLAIRRVKGMGDKTFEQAAGFLRIPDGETLLDNTGVHPESYPVVKRLLQQLDLSLDDPGFTERLLRLRPSLDLPALARSLEVGEPTLADILNDLTRPGRDPRSELPAPILRSDVLKMEDLKPGMKLKGTVRNVVDFGAFVDIGVKQDGLVHISELSEFRVRDPYEIVSVGDVVDVTVKSVDPERGRIALSMRE